MGYQVQEVTYEIDAQKHIDGRFNVPKKVCNILGLKYGDHIRLMVLTLGGELLYHGEKQMKSGSEIYGPEIRLVVKAGQRIKVIASRPYSYYPT
jgi:hypothetical protein